MKDSSLKKDLTIKHIKRALYELEVANRLTPDSVPKICIDTLRYELDKKTK